MFQKVSVNVINYSEQSCVMAKPSIQRLKKHYETLKILKKSSPVFRKAIINAADDSLIICICECIKNVLYGDVKLTQKNKEELKKFLPLMEKLCKRDKSLNKRKLIVQNGGFLPALLAPVLGIASGLIGDLVSDLIK